MNYKPNDFFIGVIDFFAVLLPGALLTFFVQAHWYGDFFGDGKTFPSLHTNTEKGLVFIIATYILGNIIFLIASIIMDRFYDKFLRNPFFKKNADLAYYTATEIREKYLHSSTLINNLLMQNKLSEAEKKELNSRRRKEVLNTYKWILNFISIKHPEALAEIKKLEADSKFFRCLVISFVLISIYSFAHLQIIIGSIFLVLALLSIYRYGDLRYKSTSRAYEFLITYYYLNNSIEENSAIANTHKLKESIQQAAAMNLSDELPVKYLALVKHLKTGLGKDSRQLIIPAGEKAPVSFTAEKDETWYCLNGKGFLLFDNTDSHALSPNSMITIKKNKNYSFVNKTKEPLELMVLKN